MSAITYYNRYTQALEEEDVYGGGYLRWVYGTRIGAASLWALVRRAVFSNWYGWRMNRRASRRKVAPFIAAYNLDAAEFAAPPESYRTFNEFFHRRLRPGARPICSDAAVAVFPADGRHLGLARLGVEEGVYVKGQHLDLEALLGDCDLAQTYAGGAAIVSRLCPVDYHRFHAPVAGRLVDQQLINGWLYSVSPLALRRNLRYLWENKRVRCVIDTPAFGRVGCIVIGATCVGGIHMTGTAGQDVAKGEELGYFAFGGSCVVTLFEAGRVRLAADLLEHGAAQREVYAHIGDEAARLEL